MVRQERKSAIQKKKNLPASNSKWIMKYAITEKIDTCAPLAT